MTYLSEVNTQKSCGVGISFLRITFDSCVTLLQKH